MILIADKRFKENPVIALTFDVEFQYRIHLSDFFFKSLKT